MVLIGIIGGSGLDNPDILKDVKEVEIETIYGKPSSKIKLGKINNINVALLARHGLTHSIPPSQVNYRANIQALKQLNCTHILATTAVGSLKKEIQRGDLVILDQFIDFTRHRKVSFHEDFNNGIKHTPMAEPFNENLRNLLIETGKSLNYKIHVKGTVITIEGPRFSTKAESKMFSNFADVINMSIAPECILANELNIPYAAIAMSTDYDCLFDDIPSVTWEDILEVFHKNSEKVKELLINVIPKIN